MQAATDMGAAYLHFFIKNATEPLARLRFFFYEIRFAIFMLLKNCLYFFAMK